MTCFNIGSCNNSIVPRISIKPVLIINVRVGLVVDGTFVYCEDNKSALLCLNIVIIDWNNWVDG